MGRAWPSYAWCWGTGLQLCWDVMGDVDHGEVRECEEEANIKQDGSSLEVIHLFPGMLLNAIYESNSPFFKCLFLFLFFFFSV